MATKRCLWLAVGCGYGTLDIDIQMHATPQPEDARALGYIAWLIRWDGI